MRNVLPGMQDGLILPSTTDIMWYLWISPASSSSTELMAESRCVDLLGKGSKMTVFRCAH